MSEETHVSTQAAAARRRPRARWKGNLALALASVVVTCLLLEVVLRILVPDSPAGTTYGEPVQLNSQGLRDREFAVPKPPGTFRVLMLGDSFTWGVGLKIGDTTPRRLQALLAELGHDAEVINAAHPGDNTVEELLRLRRIADHYDPDLVVVVYNLNDIEYRPELVPASVRPDIGSQEAGPVVEIDPGEDITRYSRNAGLRGVVLAAERRSLLVRFLVPRVGFVLRRLGLLDSVEVSWVEKIFEGFHDGNPGWRESRRALGEIADVCASRSCGVLVAVFPLLVDLDHYGGGAAHAAIESACTEQGIEFLDLLPVFEGTHASSHWINVIDSHPDAAAHEAVARALLPAVLKGLSPATPRSPKSGAGLSSLG